MGKELAEIDLGDKRLNDRARVLMERLSADTAASINMNSRGPMNVSDLDSSPGCQDSRSFELAKWDRANSYVTSEGRQLLRLLRNNSKAGRVSVPFAGTSLPSHALHEGRRILQFREPLGRRRRRSCQPVNAVRTCELPCANHREPFQPLGCSQVIQSTRAVRQGLAQRRRHSLLRSSP